MARDTRYGCPEECAGLFARASRQQHSNPFPHVEPLVEREPNTRTSGYEARVPPQQGKRAPVAPLTSEKVRITIRLDREIVDHFRDKVRKADRGNYQTLINDALRDYLQWPSLAQQVRAEVRVILSEEPGKVKVSA